MYRLHGATCWDNNKMIVLTNGTKAGDIAGSPNWKKLKKNYEQKKGIHYAAGRPGFTEE
jgi:hypothetical protein